MPAPALPDRRAPRERRADAGSRSEEHTSELQSHSDLVCRLLLEKKNKGYTPLPGAQEFIAAVSAYYVQHANIPTCCVIMEGAAVTASTNNGVERQVKAAVEVGSP